MGSSTLHQQVCHCIMSMTATIIPSACLKPDVHPERPLIGTRRDGIMHPTCTTVIDEEGLLPKRQRCGMHWADTRQHCNSKTCKYGELRREQRERSACQQLARNGTKFFIDGCPLDRVRGFKYLGRIVSSQDEDWPAIQWQLHMAQGRWARVSRVLTWEGANPRVSGMFYKAVCQTVLIHGARGDKYQARNTRHQNILPTEHQCPTSMR